MPDVDGGARKTSAVLLLVAAMASVGLISLVDEPCYALAIRYFPSRAWIAHARLTSFVVVALLYGAIARSTRSSPRRRNWRRALLLSAGWILITTLFIALTPGMERGAIILDKGDQVSILFTNLWAEELLFRGVLFRLGDQVFPAAPSLVVIITASLAALSHWQYHHFEVSRAAGIQIALSLPGCLVYSSLRRYSGAPWLSGGVHFTNNLVTLLCG